MKETYRGIKTTCGCQEYDSCIENNNDRKWWHFWKPITIKKSKPGKWIYKTYFERAYDRNGIGLLIGDEVRVVSIENNPEWSLGQTYIIDSVFEGDLVLKKDDYSGVFYCWPGNVRKE